MGGQQEVLLPPWPKGRLEQNRESIHHINRLYSYLSDTDLIEK